MISDDQWVVARSEAYKKTLYTTLWHVGDVYAQIEAHDHGLIIASIKVHYSTKPKIEILDWHGFDALNNAKEWCITQLTKHRLET